MSKATPARFAFRQLLKRVGEQKSLMHATEQVEARPKQKPIPEALPENIPGTVTDDAVAMPDEALPAGTPEPQTRVEPQPYSKQETEGVMDEFGKETPDKGTITEDNLINQARTTYPEGYGEFANAILKTEEARGNLQERKTFKGIKEESTAVKWETIREKQQSGTPLNTEELRKLRDVDAAMHRQFADETDAMLRKQENGTLTEEDEFQYRQNLAAVGDISAYLHGEKRRIAQSLASMRDTADNPGIRKFQRKDFLDLMNSQEEFGDLLTRVKMAKTADEFKKIVRDDKWYKKMGRVAGNVWYNAVLSKFAVGKAFLGGISINKFVYPVEALYGSFVSKVRIKMGDDLANYPALNRQVQAGEAMLEFMGMFQGLTDAIEPIWKHLKDPEYDLGPVKLDHKVIPKDTLYANYGGQSTKKDVMLQLVDGWSQNGSRRFMMMTDFMIRSMTFQQKTKAMAYRIAASEGLEGQALIDRVTEVLREMPDDVFNEAVDAGKRTTMTQDLQGSMKKIQEGIGKVPGARFFLPFMRTMFAMLDMSLERTPGIAMMTTRVQQEWAKGGAARDMVIARQMFGLSLMGLGFTMGMSGTATSGAYLSKQDQSDKMKSGWRPNALVNKQGEYVSIGMMSPVYEMFQFGVAVYEISKYMNAGLKPEDPRYKNQEEVIAEIIGGSAWTFADITLNKAVGQSTRELLEAINDPKTSGKYKTLRTLTPFFTPGFGTGLLTRAVDPERKRVPSGSFLEELIGNIQANMPGLSDNLPPAIGFFGEHKPEYSLLDGFSWSPTDENADLFVELYRNGLATKMPNRTIRIGLSNINLDEDIQPEDFTESALISPATKQEYQVGDTTITIPAAGAGEAKKRGYAYYRYSQIRGSMYKGILTAVIKSDGYKNPGRKVVEEAEAAGLSVQAMILQSAMRKANIAAGALLKKELLGSLRYPDKKLGETIQKRDPSEAEFIPPGLTRKQERQREEYDAENERLRQERDLFKAG